MLPGTIVETVVELPSEFVSLIQFVWSCRKPGLHDISHLRSLEMLPGTIGALLPIYAANLPLMVRFHSELASPIQLVRSGRPLDFIAEMLPGTIGGV